MEHLELILSLLATVVFGIVSYLLNKTDKAQEDKLAAQQASIALLFKKHDDDAAALVLLQRQIDKEHYIKPELDARFQSLETTFRQGFEVRRAEFKELSRVLLDHRLNGKAGEK